MSSVDPTRHLRLVLSRLEGDVLPSRHQGRAGLV